MFRWLEKINLFNRTRISNGIQITDELIRFVSFEVKKDSIATRSFGEEFLSGDVVRDGKIINHDRLIQALTTLQKKYKLETATVVLPEEQSFIFYTTVPYVENTELKSVVQDHIVSYLKLHSKISVKDIVCEYDVVGAHNKNYEIQVTVTPRSIIDSYKHVFEQSGIFVSLFEVGSHMVSKACLGNDEGSSCMFVDFGEYKTHISIVSEGDVMESSTIPVGQQHLPSVIEKFLNVNRHEADHILKKHGILRTHKEPQLLSDLLHELSPIRDFIDRQFVKWHTREYKTRKQQAPIQKILLHGEGAHLQGFAEHLATSTKIPVEHANVWATQSDYDDAVPDISYEDSHRYATTISAALRGKE